jgi:hypothetical protein
MEKTIRTRGKPSFNHESSSWLSHAFTIGPEKSPTCYQNSQSGSLMTQGRIVLCSKAPSYCKHCVLPSSLDLIYLQNPPLHLARSSGGHTRMEAMVDHESHTSCQPRWSCFCEPDLLLLALYRVDFFSDQRSNGVSHDWGVKSVDYGSVTVWMCASNCSIGLGHTVEVGRGEGDVLQSNLFTKIDVAHPLCLLTACYISSVMSAAA